MSVGAVLRGFSRAVGCGGYSIRSAYGGLFAACLPPVDHPIHMHTPPEANGIYVGAGPSPAVSCTLIPLPLIRPPSDCCHEYPDGAGVCP